MKEILLGSKEQMIVSDGEDGVLVQEVPKIKRDLPALNEEQLTDLVDLALKSEHHFGEVPQDIEWALKDDVLYLLQSRPITNLPPAPRKNL